ncbi:hypothetical protein WN48_07366 [Eufriesea mexicana]|nr:hypothetical protein WN48_07366 [Eufriesea mexicana]
MIKELSVFSVSSEGMAQQERLQNNHTYTFMYTIFFIYLQKLVYEIFFKDHKNMSGKTAFCETRNSFLGSDIIITIITYLFNALFSIYMVLR